MDAVQKSPVSGIAQQALERIRAARSSDEARKTGDTFLGSVAAEGGASDAEKALAAASRTAAGLRLSTTSARNVHNAALHALVAGVPGPLGPVLAGVALKSFDGAYSSDDRRALARSFLASLGDNAASPAEKSLAATVRGTLDLKVTNTTANTLAKQAVSSVAAGVSGTAEQALSAFGTYALGSSYSSDDARAVGRKVLGAIGAQAAIPDVAALATWAASITGKKMANRSASVIQGKAFELLGQAPAPLPSMMVTVGLAGMAGAYSSDDARVIGRATLEGLSGSADAAGRLAGIAKRVADLKIANKSANAVTKTALERIGQGAVADPLPAEIARLAKAGVAGAYSQDDGRKIAGVLMAALGEGGDVRTRALIDFERKVKYGTQKIFDALCESRAQAPSTVGVVDAEAEEINGLARALEVEKDIASDLERAVSSREANVAAADAEAARAQGDLDAARVEVAPIIRKIDRHRKIGFGGLLVAGAGLVGVSAGGGPIAVGVMAVGAAVGLGGGLVPFTRAQSEYVHASFRIHDAQFKVQLQQMMAQSHRESLASFRKQRDVAVGIVREHDAKVSMHRMTAAVNAPQPDRDARVSVDDEAVTIGTLRIPKKR